MKKIGLVGGTGPESTLVYYKELNRIGTEISKGTAFPEIAIESINLTRSVSYVSSGQYDKLTEYLLNAIRNLEYGGADIVALTAATMHVVYDQLAPQVKVPFISIPETAAEYAVSRGYKKVGLLGTIFTMEKDYLSKAFVNRGIEVVVPDGEDRLLVNDRIYNELEYAIIKDSTIQELQQVITRMKDEQGIEALILGCTELPLALNDGNSPVPCIDIMGLHIKRLGELMAD